MAAPTLPTRTTIVTEAIKKAGHASPSAAQITRAEDYWMNEIANDIWNRCKTLKSLQTTAVMVTTDGLDRYSMPTDYSHGMTMEVLDGNSTGTAQAGAAGSITLAATETFVAGDLLGKEILVYEGTGKGSCSTITAYDTTTKVATVTPNFTTAPAASDKYMIVDSYRKLDEKPLWNLAGIAASPQRDKPSCYIPSGDADYGEFTLFPTPYRTNSVPYGIRQRYYANLMTLDLAGTLMATLYSRWRNVWIQGVFAKQLQDDNDDRAMIEMQAYGNMLTGLIMREQYGMDLSSLQCTVGDN